MTRERIIHVTRPLLPNSNTVMAYIEDILKRGWVTNDGPFVQQLERQLAQYLDVPEVALVTNATVGLDLALRSAVPEGEVVTTGYSFPATYHVILNNGKLEPVFVDITEDFSLDPEALEACITPRTRAILAVHTYGYPCDVERLERLARKYNLTLIYDGACVWGPTGRAEHRHLWQPICVQFSCYEGFQHVGGRLHCARSF